MAIAKMKASPWADWSDDALIEKALAYKDANKRWSVVMALHGRTSPGTLAKAVELLFAPAVKQRTLGADILGQLGYQKKRWKASERCTALLRQLRTESSATVLCRIGMALGHMREKRAVGPLKRLVTHRDADVRYAAVHGLSGVDSRPALTALIRLSKDKAAKVRDWATFGLGAMTDADFPALRQALRERLDDRDYDTRLEAIAGLAERKDPEARQIVEYWLKTRLRVPRCIWDSAETLGIDREGIRSAYQERRAQR